MRLAENQRGQDLLRYKGLATVTQISAHSEIAAIASSEQRPLYCAYILKLLLSRTYVGSAVTHASACWVSGRKNDRLL